MFTSTYPQGAPPTAYPDGGRSLTAQADPILLEMPFVQVMMH